MKAVITHGRWASPPSSPTMRGSAVLTMFWSSEASAMVVNSPANRLKLGVNPDFRELVVCSPVGMSAVNPNVDCAPPVIRY
jgi:hypothetical protein